MNDDHREIPDPITLLEGLLPGNPFQGEPPLPRGLLALMEEPEPEPEANSPDLAPEVHRPGCTAADNAGVALFHLEGLALEGKLNFGVLRISKQRLEDGAAAAESLGRRDVAQQMRRIAAQLPEVHSPEAAHPLAQELRDLAYNLAWDLGASCKGSFTPQALEQARLLAQQVHAGTLSVEDAIRQVRAGHQR
jgi:hypothetical protein